MNSPLRSITEQIADILRQGIQSGRWQGHLPGRVKLSQELEVSSMTVTRAFQLLEKEGLLESPEPGRNRQIKPKALLKPRAFRVTFWFNADRLAKDSDINELKHLLTTGLTHFGECDILGNLGLYAICSGLG